MQENTKFPSWLLAVEKAERSKIKPQARDFFHKSLACYPHFHEVFLSCPRTSEIGILNTYELSVLKEHYDYDNLFHFVVGNISEIFHYQYVYQVRELALAMHRALEDGSFYAAAILNRSIFEVVCTNYYTFRRIEENFEHSLRLLQEATKTKSEVEQQKIIAKHYEILYEIFSLVYRANSASSIDWAVHLKQFGFKEKLPEPSKPIHVNTAIADIEKVSKLPLMKVYALMSEFVHPNFGSKTLVINTKQPYQECMDVLILGDNAGNHEAALFYIDQLSESLYYTLTLACSLHDRSVKFLDAIFRFIPTSDNRILH